MLKIPQVFFGHAGTLPTEEERRARFSAAFPGLTYLDAPEIAMYAKVMRCSQFLDFTFEEDQALLDLYCCACAATGRSGDVNVNWTQDQGEKQ